MHKFLLLYLLILLTSKTFSQTFIRTYDTGGNGSKFFLAPDSGYYLIDPSAANLKILHVDRFGDSLWTKSIPARTICQRSDLSFSAVGILNDSITIYKIDTSGNIFSSITLVDSIPDNINQIISTTDGGLLLAGSYWPALMPQDSYTYLIKTDSNDNVVWTKSMLVNQGCGQGLAGLLETTDHHYLISAYHSSCSMSVGNYIVARIDSSGTINWGYFSSHFLTSNVQPVLEVPDGFLIGESLAPDNHTAGNFQLTKIDTVGNLSWSKEIINTDANYTTTARSIAGGIYACGSLRGMVSHSDVLITRFTDVGDSLYSFTFSIGAQNGLYYMKQLDDGRLACIGQVNSGSTALTTQMLFMVIDSAGVILNRDEKAMQSELFIFPNPVKNVLSVMNEVDCKISIYDLRGKLTLQKNYTNEIDVSSLEAGVYLIEIIGQNTISKSKFIKE